jgi:hypothetical protein
VACYVAAREKGVAMSNNLTDFLVRLAGDSQLQSRYEADRATVMDEAGLDDDEKAALESGDHVRIASQLDFEGHTGFVPICFCRFS